MILYVKGAIYVFCVRSELQPVFEKIAIQYFGNYRVDEADPAPKFKNLRNRELSLWISLVWADFNTGKGS